MRVLYRAISAEERGARSTRKATPKYQRPLPPAPKARKVKAEELNEDLALALAGRVEEEITFDWLRDHSPVEIPGNPRAWGELLLNELYPAGARILVFTAFASQGQYMYIVKDGVYKLGRKPGVEPVKAPRLPAGGDAGVWYLTAPVTGKWEPNPGKRDAMGNLMPGRRHAADAAGVRHQHRRGGAAYGADADCRVYGAGQQLPDYLRLPAGRDAGRCYARIFTTFGWF